MTPALVSEFPRSPHRYVSLRRAEAEGLAELRTAPRTLRIVVENILRHAWRAAQRAEDGTELAAGLELASAVLSRRGAGIGVDIGFHPTRLILQDHSGVPVLADLAALRSLLAEQGLDPRRAGPALPTDLVVDHSVEAAETQHPSALEVNMSREYRLNAERYRFLKWARQAFDGLRVVPPGRGIVHQIHLEHLAPVVMTDGAGLLAPDTVLGTDSHTPMVNALGVLGWGVGGIEAMLALLGTSVSLSAPHVVGVHLVGTAGPDAQATDLALAMAEYLRAQGVVGAFVEFHGPAAATLSLPDRATIANMAPEYGCTTAFFPVDEATLDYLTLTGRSADQVRLVAEYAQEQGLFGATAWPRYDRDLEFDLSHVSRSAAGPRRPQDRLSLSAVAARNRAAAPAPGPRADDGPADGAVAIAAITSCTNTSNPRAMVIAGLVARRAVERGLRVPPWVKTSLAPGSRVVTGYLSRAGLLDSLDTLGFRLVGYGCTTCIGNSGDLRPMAGAAGRAGRRLAAVLSGNRNFEGRIHREITDAYLVSPPIVVAYALAGSARVDVTREPLGTDADGTPVFLADLWPLPAEVTAAMATVDAGLFAAEKALLYTGDDRWRALPAPAGPTYDWPADSSYLVRSPLLGPADGSGLADLHGARALVVAGDNTTTDHISPAGEIGPDSLAAQYLRQLGMADREFNTYGCRRGNHEVMVRGTFANPRFCNRLVPEAPGGWTLLLPERRTMPIFEAARRYAQRGTPVIVLAGQDYGMGSSRDWAAKGQTLLGVRAVLARSFERIHRSNLIGMGIVPLQFLPGDGVERLELTGTESFDIEGLADLRPGRQVSVVARAESDGHGARCRMIARVDTEGELFYVMQGGFLRATADRLLRDTGTD